MNPRFLTGMKNELDGTITQGTLNNKTGAIVFFPM